MSVGRHILIDVFEVPFKILDDEKLILRRLVRAARKAGATVLHSHAHHFEPHGVSCVVIISESHFTIHTWPEASYAAVDLFTCGKTVNLDLAMREILSFLQGGYSKVTTVERGAIRDERLGVPSDIRFI